MCYGCELNTSLGENTVGEYLSIRGEYDEINKRMNALLSRMLKFEQVITDREQRKTWHATRARIAQAKKMAGEAFTHVRPTTF